ncbi:MAG: hypothetical protein U0903_00160 [Planctomycetales bacterium]
MFTSSTIRAFVTSLILLGIISPVSAAGKKQQVETPPDPLTVPRDVMPMPAEGLHVHTPMPTSPAVSGHGGWLPGGPAAAVGNPYYYQPQTYDPAAGMRGDDPYTLHFGPGYYRSGEYGHHRFPWYSYRRPWYFPGHTSYNRDTNVPW